jgi:hypothetical protein
MGNVKWEKIFYASGNIKYEGFTKYDTNGKELIPAG